MEAVQALVRECCYKPGIDKKEAFLFGYKLDSHDHAYVWCVDDDDPFIIGLTSGMLIDNSLLYASRERFSIFHEESKASPVEPEPPDQLNDATPEPSHIENEKKIPWGSRTAA
ncbi:unnamed protein product [Phytophthora fragariaefolia]|uniref:Unnamed protein product n=1 Tax=Phytophthora fragariaefolia TaxID=1490495 RepID=A0A9W7DFP3_9STRA|nr:unnamed protein product [Phytophthora fragariaefolia]